MHCKRRESFCLTQIRPYGSNLHRYASVEASTKVGTDVPLPPDWPQFKVESWLLVHATSVNTGKPIEVDMDIWTVIGQVCLFPHLRYATLTQLRTQLVLDLPQEPHYRFACRVLEWSDSSCSVSC